MTVRYKSATVDEFIENHSHDISKGGIFIKTRAPFPAGTLLKFEVRIAEDQRLMQGVGRVVWRREPERAEDGFPAGMGIKFIKTGEGAAELISQIVDARQGEESSFEAGARANGADAEAPLSAGARHPAVAATADVSEPPHPDTPSLQVESTPGSLPADGEIRVSSPAKKRPAAPETRKVVLQGAAFDAPSSDKTPISTQARVLAAQVAAERAPSRPAPAAKDRGSFVDETTAPRARAGSDGKSARAAAQQQSSPSIYGLVAILGLVGLGLLVVRLVRGPENEPAAPPSPVVATTTPPPSPPPQSPPAAVPLPSAVPSAAAPAAETGEHAAEPAAAAPAPSAPAAAAPNSGAGGAAAKPSVPPVAAAPGSPAPKAAPTAAAPVASAPTKPPAPAPAALAAKPAAPAAVPAKPPVAAAAAAGATAAVAPKPKATPKPPAATDPTASIHPSTPEGEPAAPGTAGASSAAEARPGEPAKKHPPAAATPSEPEPAKPAPSPKPAPSDDNPY